MPGKSTNVAKPKQALGKRPKQQVDSATNTRGGTIKVTSAATTKSQKKADKKAQQISDDKKFIQKVDSIMSENSQQGENVAVDATINEALMDFNDMSVFGIKYPRTSADFKTVTEASKSDVHPHKDHSVQHVAENFLPRVGNVRKPVYLENPWLTFAKGSISSISMRMGEYRYNPKMFSFKDMFEFQGLSDYASNGLKQIPFKLKAAERKDPTMVRAAVTPAAPHFIVFSLPKSRYDHTLQCVHCKCFVRMNRKHFSHRCPSNKQPEFASLYNSTADLFQGTGPAEVRHPGLGNFNNWLTNPDKYRATYKDTTFQVIKEESSPETVQSPSVDPNDFSPNDGVVVPWELKQLLPNPRFEWQQRINAQQYQDTHGQFQHSPETQNKRQRIVEDAIRNAHVSQGVINQELSPEAASQKYGYGPDMFLNRMDQSLKSSTILQRSNLPLQRIRGGSDTMSVGGLTPKGGSIFGNMAADTAQLKPVNRMKHLLEEQQEAEINRLKTELQCSQNLVSNLQSQITQQRHQIEHLHKCNAELTAENKYRQKQPAVQYSSGMIKQMESMQASINVMRAKMDTQNNQEAQFQEYLTTVMVNMNSTLKQQQQHQQQSTPPPTPGFQVYGDSQHSLKSAATGRFQENFPSPDDPKTLRSEAMKTPPSNRVGILKEKQVTVSDKQSSGSPVKQKNRSPSHDKSDKEMDKSSNV